MAKLKANAKANGNGKAKAKPEAKAKAKPEASKAVALYTISAKAMQKTVGPAVIKIQQAESQFQEQVRDWTGKVEIARNEAIGRLNLAVYQICKADPKNINPADSFSADAKVSEALINKLQIALGAKYQEPDGKLNWTPEVQAFFPARGSTKATRETPEYRKKDQSAKNWATSLKSAAKAVLGMMENNTVPSFNEEAKALEVKNPPKLLAGPGVKSLILTGAKTKTGERASIEAFKKLATKKHKPAAAAPGKAGTATNRAQAALQSEDTFGETCNVLIGVINSLDGTLSANQRKHLEALRARIDVALEWPIVAKAGSKEAEAIKASA